MVIPVGGGMGMQGPPPPELQAEFQRVKVCLLAMIASMMVKLASGTLLYGFLQVLSSCLNLGLNTLMGIFLLRDDHSIGKIYQFLMNNCFQSCGQMCTGGMGCLVPFVLCNFITVVLDLLLGPTLIIVIKEVPLLLHPAEWASPVAWLENLAFTLSAFSALAAQGAAAYFGWQAYKVAASSFLGPDVPYMPLGPGQQLGGGQPPAPSRSGGGGGYVPPTVRQAPAAQPFQPFSGQGQRLGGR